MSIRSGKNKRDFGNKNGLELVRQFLDKTKHWKKSTHRKVLSKISEQGKINPHYKKFEFIKNMMQCL